MYETCKLNGKKRKILRQRREEFHRIDPWAQLHQRSTYSFYEPSSQKRKKIDNFTVSFMLLGSMQVKAVHRMWMKLTPGINYAII